MSAQFKWTGLDELIAEFTTLPQDLTAAAAPTVEAAAEAARQTIRSGYPSRTGDLRDHLQVVTTRDDTGVKAVVINTSRHAAVFEQGSQARHTAIGANRGSMPANPIFTATMIRERRRLYATPIPRVLIDFGLKVVGAP